jgi:hypothetical protein
MRSSQRMSKSPPPTCHNQPAFRSASLRGNEPRGQRRPRSRIVTRRPAWAKRAPATAPPKPLPTTMASRAPLRSTYPTISQNLAEDEIPGGSGDSAKPTTSHVALGSTTAAPVTVRVTESAGTSRRQGISG